MVLLSVVDPLTTTDELATSAPFVTSAWTFVVPVDTLSATAPPVIETLFAVTVPEAVILTFDSAVQVKFDKVDKPVVVRVVQLNAPQPRAVETLAFPYSVIVVGTVLVPSVSKPDIVSSPTTLS
jgi:hypothetical protein